MRKRGPCSALLGGGAVALAVVCAAAEPAAAAPSTSTLTSTQTMSYRQPSQARLRSALRLISGELRSGSRAGTLRRLSVDLDGETARVLKRSVLVVADDAEAIAGRRDLSRFTIREVMTNDLLKAGVADRDALAVAEVVADDAVDIALL